MNDKSTADMTEAASNDNSFKPNAREQHYGNYKETEDDAVEEEDSINNNEIINPDTGDDLDDDDYTADFVDNEIQPFWKIYLNDINKVRYVIGGVVNNKKVQAFIVALIAINAIMMGIGTFEFVTENDTMSDNFESIDKAILVIFTIEMVMQFIYHGWRMILDGWLVFDASIVLLSYTFNGVQIVRAFRIFRALRLLTRIKVMKNLMLALFGVMPRMLAIVILLGLVFYMFAVMFTQLFGDLGPEGLGVTEVDYFSKLIVTLFTLFQIMTMDNWAVIVRSVEMKHPYAMVYFIPYIIITGFIVVNLIVAVICDAISALHDDDKAKLLGMYDEAHEETSEEKSTGNENSEGSSTESQMDTQEQIESLEQQIEQMSRIQEETLEILDLLSIQLQTGKTENIPSVFSSGDSTS